jgi:hypothetical protein
MCPDDDVDELIVKVVASLLKNRGHAHDLSKEKVVDAYDLFSRAHIFPINVRRESPQGEVTIQSVSFGTDDQRLRVLGLLTTHGVYEKLSGLERYIYELGCNDDTEIRYFAALAVGQLVRVLPFFDLTQSIIEPWAINGDQDVRMAAAIALQSVVENGVDIEEVLNLIDHWVGIGRPRLIDTGLLTLQQIGSSCPEKSMDVIKKVVSVGTFGNVIMVINVTECLYKDNQDLVIKHLCSWLKSSCSDNCRWLTVLLFRCVVNQDDIVNRDELYNVVSEAIVLMWEDSTIPFHENVHEEITGIVRQIAVKSLESYENDKLLWERCLALFRTVYDKFEGRRNVLDFYLRRWADEHSRLQKLHERHQMENVEGVVPDMRAAASFLDLIPTP